MTVAELIRYRRGADLSQSEMARSIGLSLRAYQEIEGRDDADELSTRHVLAIERSSLRIAVERGSLDLALPEVRRDARALMDIFDGRRARALT